MPPLLFPSPHGGAAVKDGECPEIKIIIHQLNFELCTLKIEKTSDNGCFFVIAREFLHLGGNWPVRYAVPLPTGAEFGAVRRHPGAGRDPVDALRQPVSFDIITQVLRSAKLDTARPRYDELPRLATLSQSTPSFPVPARRGRGKRRGISGGRTKFPSNGGVPERRGGIPPQSGPAAAHLCDGWVMLGEGDRASGGGGISIRHITPTSRLAPTILPEPRITA